MFSVEKIQVFLINGESMQPFFQKYAVIITKQSDVYQIGDIISFNKSNQVITHRINEIKLASGQVLYYTKGDNNDVTDDMPHSKKEIIGKVVWFSNLLGNIFSTLVIEKYGILPVLAILGYLTGIQLKRLLI